MRAAREAPDGGAHREDRHRQEPQPEETTERHDAPELLGRQVPLLVKRLQHAASLAYFTSPLRKKRTKWGQPKMHGYFRSSGESSTRMPLVRSILSRRRSVQPSSVAMYLN